MRSAQINKNCLYFLQQGSNNLLRWDMDTIEKDFKQGKVLAQNLVDFSVNESGVVVTLTSEGLIRNLSTGASYQCLPKYGPQFSAITILGDTVTVSGWKVNETNSLIVINASLIVHSMRALSFGTGNDNWVRSIHCWYRRDGVQVLVVYPSSHVDLFRLKSNNTITAFNTYFQVSSIAV